MITLALTHYNALKFVHVLAAVVWVGGACVVQVYALLAVRTNDPVRVAAFAGDTEFVGTRIFIPSSLILLVSGLFTVHESGGLWGYGQGWVQFGLAIVVLSILVGAGYLGPESGRIARATERRGGVGRGAGAHPPHLPRVADRAGAAARGDLRHGGQARHVTPGAVGPCA